MAFGGWTPLLGKETRLAYLFQLSSPNGSYPPRTLKSASKTVQATNVVLRNITAAHLYVLNDVRHEAENRSGPQQQRKASNESLAEFYPLRRRHGRSQFIQSIQQESVGSLPLGQTLSIAAIQQANPRCRHHVAYTDTATISNPGFHRKNGAFFPNSKAKLQHILHVWKSCVSSF